MQTVSELERKIDIIKHDASNYIGGEKAYYSGKQTFLKDAALNKIAALNKKIDRIYNSMSI